MKVQDPQPGFVTGSPSRADEQLVAFRLDAESFGIHVATVREIVTMQPITHVPGAPRFVEGVINLRGQIVPVVDLRRRFGMPEAERNAETRIVVAEVSDCVVGLVVDSVTEVLTVSGSDVEPPSPAIAGPRSLFIRGLAKVGDKLLVLLSLDHLLTAEDLSIHLDPGEAPEGPDTAARRAGMEPVAAAVHGGA